MAVGQRRRAQQRARDHDGADASRPLAEKVERRRHRIGGGLSVLRRLPAGGEGESKNEQRDSGFHRHTPRREASAGVLQNEGGEQRSKNKNKRLHHEDTESTKKKIIP